ncbi:MAG TPA: hypothetical protein PLP01_15520, partial [Phycisphaerae bacterium]|nr:hypothetical protein [Phycisphaerae bacterium]
MELSGMVQPYIMCVNRHLLVIFWSAKFGDCQAVGGEGDGAVLVLDCSPRDVGAARGEHVAAFLVHVGEEDALDHGGFVFQGHEHHELAVLGAGAARGDEDAGHAHAAAHVFAQAAVGHAVGQIEPFAQDGH